MTKLLACPFCGTTEGLQAEGTTVHLVVHCHGCETDGPLSSVPVIEEWPLPAGETERAVQGAIDKWNSRAELPLASAERAVVEAAIRWKTHAAVGELMTAVAELIRLRTAPVS